MMCSFIIVYKCLILNTYRILIISHQLFIIVVHAALRLFSMASKSGKFLCLIFFAKMTFSTFLTSILYGTAVHFVIILNINDNFID